MSDIFNIDLDKKEQKYVRKNFSSSAPTSKTAVRAALRVHGRKTRNNTPGIIPTSEGGGKRSRAEDVDWNLTKAEQERTNEFKWSRVPTYEGGRESKRVATSEGGKKSEPPEQEENFYDCLDEQDMDMYDCLSEDDEEDDDTPDKEKTQSSMIILRKPMKDFVGLENVGEDIK